MYIKKFIRFVKRKRSSRLITKRVVEDIIDNIPGHVYWTDRDGMYLGCNKLQVTGAGYASSSQIIGKTDYEIKPREEAEAICNLDRELMEKKIAATSEEFSISKFG